MSYFVEGCIAQYIVSGQSLRGLFQGNPEVQRIREHRSQFPTHTAVLKWVMQGQGGFALHRHSGSHVSHSVTLAIPQKESSSSESSKMGPEHIGKCLRDQVQSINFILSKWCRWHTYHFHSRSILENLVLWPHLISRETGKCNLLVGWGNAQKKRRMDLGQQWRVSTTNMIK